MNPFQAMSFMRNPLGAVQQQMLQRMERENPQMYRKVMQMTSGKSDDEQKAIAENIAKERGIDLAAFARNWGLSI